MAEAQGRLMVIFSLGGLTLQRRLRGGAVRCRTGFVALGGLPRVVLDSFPARSGQGVVEDGRAALVRDGVEVASRPLGSAGGVRLRLDDLGLLGFVGGTLWTWLALPLVVADPPPALLVRELHGPGEDGLRRVEVAVPAGWPAMATRHVLHLDPAGRVHRHEEAGLVHHLSGHCDFGGVEVATSRRTRIAGKRNLTVAWSDVVAAHVLPAPQPGGKSLN